MDERIEYDKLVMLEKRNRDSLFEESCYRAALYTKDGNGPNGAITQELVDYLSDIIEACIRPSEYKKTHKTRHFISDFRQLALYVIENADKIAYSYDVYDGAFICHYEPGIVEYDVVVKADKDFKPVDDIEIDIDVLDPVTRDYEGCGYSTNPGGYGGHVTFDFNHYWPYLNE